MLNKLFKPTKDVFKWYYALIYLLVIAIPFNHKEAFSIYDPDLVWSKYALISLAVIGLFLFIKNFKDYSKDIFFWFLISFVGFQSLSLLQTGDVVSSLRLIAFQLAITFTYIPVRNFIFERKDGVKDLVTLYGLTFIAVLVFLGIQIYLQTNYKIAIGGVWPVPEYPTRYGSTFWDINHFGAFCSALILILLGFIIAKDRVGTATRIFFGLLAIGALTALHLTSSRSSLIGFIFGLLVFGVLSFKNLKFKTASKYQFGIYYLSTIAGILGFLSLFYWKADSIRESLLYRSVSFFSHLFLLKVGIIVGIQNFLLGIGANSFHAYFRNTEWANVYYYIDKAALDLKLPLHNLWLEVLAETGLVSFIVFAAFWAVLITGLYRIYLMKNDFTALGFLGAIVSFLTAGFMYSYKSEFFWMFVLIASAYVAKFYITQNLINTIRNILCPEKCDLKRIIVVALSIATLIVPVIFLTHPLNGLELSMFSQAFKPNFIVDQYSWLLSVFKYVIGNYVYTGRILAGMFYVGSIALLFLILKRYIGGFYSLAFTSLIFGIANIIEPNLIVSIKLYLVFVVLAIAGFFLLIMSFIRETYIFNLGKKVSNLILIALLSVTIILGLISNNLYFKKSYDVNLTFLLELAYNRHLMDKALIQVSDDIDLMPVYYFADNTVRDGHNFYNIEGDVMPAQLLAIDYYDKNLFIFSEDEKDNIYKILGNIKEDRSVDFVELKQGNYYLIFIEKKSVPFVYLQ